MDNSWISMVVIVALAAIVSYAIQPRRSNDERLTAWRAEEENALAQLSIQVSEALYSVDGASATTVDRTEGIATMDSGHIVHLSVQRFLRNPQGEYFMWLWRSDNKPYVKHVPQVNARIVLKHKYIPPRGGASRPLKS